MSAESCAALKAEAQKKDPAVKVPTYLFRPNIVLSGGPAYFEDQLRIVRVNNTLFRTVRFCDRCKAMAYDYETGKRNKYMEPYATIMRTRMLPDKGGLFGIYA